MEQYVISQTAKVIASQIIGLSTDEISRNQYDIQQFNDFDHIPVFENENFIGVFDNKKKDITSIDINHLSLNTELLLNSNCPITKVLDLLGREGYVILIDEQHNFLIITESDVLKQPFRIFVFNSSPFSFSPFSPSLITISLTERDIFG